MMTKRRVARMMLAAGTVGLLILPALVYTQVTGRVLNPRLRVTYPDLQTAVNNAGPGDTLLVSGTLSGANAVADLTGFTGRIVAGRGLRGTLDPGTALTCPAAVIDASSRAGAVVISGLKILVPNGCVGVLADAATGTGGGNPLTVQGVLFVGKTATSVFTAIRTVDETDGPFLFSQNTITGQLDPGIDLGGDGTTAIEASLFRNRITNTGTGGSGNGIEIADIPMGSTVTVQRNLIDGGGTTNGIGTGVDLTGGSTEGVLIERNTIRNFAAGTGVGFAMDDDDEGVVFRRNVVNNNKIGIQVDFSGANPTTFPTITLNNITGSPTTQVGLEYTPNGGTPTNLDATNNFWGASSGPQAADTGFCPEFTNPPTCTTAATANGSGMPVNRNAGGDDCDGAAGGVITCPFRTAPVFPAGG